MDMFIEQMEEINPKNIIILSGAGISTNSGIPDYMGLNRDKLFKDKNFIKKLEILTNNAKPTMSHKLGKILNDKNLLVRIYTQNIDGLYQKGGVPNEKIVEFHGSFENNNIINYGDVINEKNLEYVKVDFNQNIDMILVMGTSLQVSPFCALPNLVKKNCLRVLVDKQPKNAFNNCFNKKHRYEQPILSYIKFGKKTVTLRSHWKDNKKFKNQIIIKDDVDNFSKKLINYLNN